ncbi:MAG: DUF177 domain-containing protein [Hydrogenophaga sp.]|nr:DUF177 domain-containing protein [Hydrogenophaga sp.]
MPSAPRSPSSVFNPRRLDAVRFAQEGAVLEGALPLADLRRLCEDLVEGADRTVAVRWSAEGEWRAGGAGGAPQGWMHLQVEATVPLTCQRCLGAVQSPIPIDRWFRFVADEAAADAQDDDCDEDLLAIEPRPDLLAVVEDELIMGLPLVPMHDTCPDHPEALSPPRAEGTEEPTEMGGRPNPFAALARLKGKQ